MISTTKNPFSADNDYSYLRLRDKATGAELFRRPVPALTHIWISPDSKYLVGISDVMLWNPYQLVVFSKSGDRLLERNMVGVNWPGVSQSVTNWINWYKAAGTAEQGGDGRTGIVDPRVWMPGPTPRQCS
jgi:hypothetical protein